MRNKNIFSIIIAGLFALISVTSFAQEETTNHSQHHGDAVDTREEVNEMVQHHLQDSHYFILFEDAVAGKHYGFPLPVILIDNGLKVFSAARFEHGNQVVKIDGQHYRLYHDGKIYKTNAEGDLNIGENGWPTNERPLDFSITKNVLAIIVISILLFILFVKMAKSYRKNTLPKGFFRVLEPLVIFVRDDIAKTNIGTNYKKYTSWLLTIFFFILMMNLLGMLPFGFNVTGNISVTFALALITFVIVQVVGNKHYWLHIFWFPDVPIIMKIVLAPIELLGIFTKPFALMIRLFANMVGGHVSLMSLLGLIVVFSNWFAGTSFFAFSVFIAVIEILVAFLQAYIFTLLSALYIGMATDDPKDHPQDSSEDIPVV